MGMTEIIDTAKKLRRKNEVWRDKKPLQPRLAAAGGGAGPPHRQRQLRGATPAPVHRWGN